MQPPRDERVTIVVLTHNRRAELCRSLTRLQALPEKHAIIVVDNGSTDDTVAYVSQDFPDVTLVETGANLGAAGRNHGVKQVRTPYVAFSDDDTWWARGSLPLAADMLDSHPQIAILNANILVGVDERPDPACSAMQSSPLDDIPGVGPALIGFMAGACVMRTRAFLEAGGYWEPLFIGGEESLLAMDILDRGGQIAYAPALRVHHWPSSQRDSPLRKRMIARNAIWTACLRLPWALAMARTRRAMAGLPDRHERTAVVTKTLREFRMLLSARRELRPETCRLLTQVWDQEG